MKCDNELNMASTFTSSVTMAFFFTSCKHKYRQPLKDSVYAIQIKGHEPTQMLWFPGTIQLWRRLGRSPQYYQAGTILQIDDGEIRSDIYIYIYIQTLSILLFLNVTLKDSCVLIFFCFVFFLFVLEIIFFLYNFVTFRIREWPP